ncbi:MAG: hypothetical protein ACYDCO_08455 [Armatimonadota bacterium]
MHRLLFGISLFIVVLLAGCARYPADQGPSDIPPVTITTEITLDGDYNPAYYYFFAIDTDADDADGPVPVVTGPELGNGWGTISGLGPDDPIEEPPFYVMFNGGSFQQFRNGEPVGQPFRGEVRNNDTIVLEIDARELVAEGDPLPNTIQVNWITMKDLTIPPQGAGYIKEYDGFGFTGYDYLAYVPLDQNRTFYSGEPGVPEETSNDTTITPAIDMIGWEVGIRLREAL